MSSPSLNLAFQTLDSVAAPLSAWAERDERARLVVDNDLVVHWKNTAAAQLMEQCPAFLPPPGPLLPRNIFQRDIFKCFVRDAGWQISRSCIRLSCDDHVICTATKLSEGNEPSLTGLTLRRARNIMAVDTKVLETVFELTTAERKVLEIMFSGHVAEEIGSRLDLTVGTIRTHLRNIYEKVDVSSREAMFCKLLPYMLDN
jgi:DNA-binding CsgD family transcriptional regulator